MGDNNKSGYQLRQELLGMATGIVCDRNNRLFDNEVMKPEGNRQPIQPYTTEDVITEAGKALCICTEEVDKISAGEARGLQVPQFIT